MSKTAEVARKPIATVQTPKRPAVREAMPSPSFPKISGWIVAGALLVLTLVFYSSHIFGHSFLWEDFVEQEFPFRTLAASSLAEGILPHWNPYIFAGMPFLADLQVAFWYPTNLLQSLFVADGYLAASTMQFFILLHYFVAGLGMFYFAKKVLEVDDLSAIFSGVAYMFGGFIVAQAIHQMIVYQMALAPFVALLLMRGWQSWPAAVGGGVVMGIMFLAGHPQTTLYLTFLLGLLAVYEITYRFAKKSDREPVSGAALVRILLPFAIALGVFAIQYLPSQELADLSRRDVMTYEKSVEGSISWGHLWTLLMPRLFGVADATGMAKVQYWNGPYYLSWETAIYVGVLPLLLALVAVASNARRKYVPFFAGMSVFALLFSLGDHFFLYKVFFQLPFFDKLRTPARMMEVFAFSIAALGGIGLSEVLRGTISERGRKAAIGIAAFFGLMWIVALTGGISATTFNSAAPPEANQSIGWAAGLAAVPILGALLAGFLIFRRKAPLQVAALVILLTVVELFVYGKDLNASPQDPADGYRGQAEVLAKIKEEQSKELSRARTRLGGQMLVKRNQGAYDRLQLIEGYNPLVLQRVSPETANPEAQADLMNITWSLVTLEGNGLDFRNRPSALPRARMYYRAEVRGDEEARELLRSDSSFDYRNVMLLEESPAATLGPEDPNARAVVTKYSQNAIDLDVSTASNGMLFLSEVYYPAWRAYIDGKPAKILRAFTTLRAVEVPSGSHKVTLRYESSAFATGSLISLITLGLSMGSLGFFLLRRRSKSEVQ